MPEFIQLDLFGTGVTCSHCGNDPGRGDNPLMWNGFRDMDTGELVGRCCYYRHYARKWQGEHRGKYSEFPVVLTEQFLKKIKAA